MSHSYLTSYHPPIPVLKIELVQPAGSLRVGPITAIIDTGADGTLIPQELLDTLKAPIVDSARIRSHWGEWRAVNIFAVDINIDEFLLPSIEVVGDQAGDELILGRNILNRLKILLDGHQLMTNVLGA